MKVFNPDCFAILTSAKHSIPSKEIGRLRCLAAMAPTNGSRPDVHRRQTVLYGADIECFPVR